MGIKFRCQGCDKNLHVKAFLAGKRGVCPHCGAKVRIPLADEPHEEGDAEGEKRRRERKTEKKTTAAARSSSIAPADAADSSRKESSPAAAGDETDPIAEAPEAVWYVRPPTGGQYGPADGEIMRRWLDEGRVSPDSLVWREGWSDWRTGDAAFGCLRPVLPHAEVPAVPEGNPSPEVEQEPIVLGDSTLAAEHGRTRLSPPSNTRGMAIVVTLAILCAALLVALWLVIQ